LLPSIFDEQHSRIESYDINQPLTDQCHSGSGMSNHRKFTRQQLYDLVWTTPIIKLAKEFGLSDVGLRKTCHRYQIPTPPLGYWAKLSSGKPVKKIALPPPGPGVGERVLVSVFAPASVPAEVAEAAARARERISTPVVVPDEAPTRLHPAAQALRKALRSAKPNDEGFLSVGGPGILVASLGPANRDRAWLIIDKLLKAAEAAGQQIKATDTGLVAVVDGESLSLRLGETKEKTAHQPTQAELKAKDNWDAQHRKWPSLYNLDRRHWRSWDYQPSGRLTLTLTDPLRSQWQYDYLLGRWNDRRTSRLEAYLSAPRSQLSHLHRGLLRCDFPPAASTTLPRTIFQAKIGAPKALENNLFSRA
jgi:hypothetical protein